MFRGGKTRVVFEKYIDIKRDSSIPRDVLENMVYSHTREPHEPRKKMCVCVSNVD